MALATALLNKPVPYGTPAAPLYGGVFAGGTSYYAPKTSSKPAPAPSQSGGSAPAASQSGSSGYAPAPAYPNGGGGSSVAAKPDRSNDIAIQNAGLGAVDSQTAAGLAAIAKALSGLTGQYDTESTANEGNYKTQSDTNQNNLQKNKQSALLNAAQGRRGLFGTLSSLGALNGDGIKLANRAVQQGANEDLSGAADTYGSNQTNLDTAIGTFRQEDKMRRENAANAAEDARTAVNNQGLKSKQTFYSNLANDYADMGDTANAKKYTDLASSLYGGIAGTNVPSSNIAYQGAAFTPGTLANYLAGGNSTQVSTSNNPDAFGIPGLVAGTKKKATA